MPAIITDKFRIHNSEQFQESFSEASPNVYYLGIGRPQAFGTLTRADSRTDYEGTDTNPITPGDTVVREFYTYDDLIAAKRVQSTGVTGFESVPWFSVLLSALVCVANACGLPIPR